MIDERIAAFPARKLSIGGKTVSWREAGSGPALVLLHGIGSSSASWLFQLEELATAHRLIAWDAPGYGESDAFSIEKPHPQDYARALSIFVNVLELRSFTLVAQSLGGLIAGAYARLFRPEKMLLISPANGYGGNHAKAKERIESLERLGPDGLAEKRAAGMLSPSAPAIALELVRWNYRRIRNDGYRQASYCLANGNLREDAPHYGGRVLVACGSADTITPEAGCREIAAAFPQASYRTLPGLGHASPAEDPAQVNRIIRELAA